MKFEVKKQRHWEETTDADDQLMKDKPTAENESDMEILSENKANADNPLMKSKETAVVKPNEGKTKNDNGGNKNIEFVNLSDEEEEKKQ